MKKLFLLKSLLLLCALVAGSSSVWAADETIDFADQGYSNAQEVTTVSGTDFSITFDKGTNANTPKYYSNNVTVPAVRVYGGGTMTISSTTKTIVKIELTFGSSDGNNDITTNTGTYGDGVWTGSSDEIVFTVGGSSGNRRFATVAVTYGVPDTRTIVNISSVSVDPTSLVVGSGETATATATHDTEGCTTASFTYVSLNPTIATCTDDGVISPVTKGTATIQATLVIPADDKNYKVGSTITATTTIEIKNPSHNVVFSINGVESTPVEVEEDDAITFPADPAAIGGQTFMGWTTAPIDGTQADAPTTLVSSANMGTEDVTYYAVFANKTVTGGEVTKTYGFETESDDNWTINGPARSTEKPNTGSYSGKITTNKG